MNTLADITVMVLTFNEEPNIDRCLARLRWASRVLVVDSFSTDRTLEIVRGYPNTTIIQRAFDTFAGQCNFGLGKIETPWVLSLDCDYILGTEFENEAAEQITDSEHAGWKSAFRYCIYGKPLSATLYPARCVLYRKAAARYEDEGHGHRVRIDGEVGDLRSRIDHDDRKPLGRWFASQMKYAEREAEHLLTAPAHELSRIDRLRARGWLMPFLAPVYCLVVKGLWRDGLAGWHYTLQRWLAECVIALAVIDRRCSNG